MRRISSLLLLVLSIAAVVATTASAARQPIVSPTADPYYRYGGLRGTEGFGQVKPREIFYGGDPTGLVCRIRWKTWGGPTARGYGTGWYVNSHQSVNQGHAAVAILTASKLRAWHGRPAYLRLTWSFPDGGRQRVPHC